MRRTFAALAALCIGLVGAVALAGPAIGITDHPQVKPAVFKSSNDVAVQVGDGVPDGWHIPAVITDTDSRLGPPPDFHFAQCSSHPAWGCIKVVRATSGAYVHATWNNSTDNAKIELNASGAPNPTQAGFCAAFGIALHFGVHRENQGCRRNNYTVDDKLFSANEMQALRNKYDRGARDPDPDTGFETGDETEDAPIGAETLAATETTRAVGVGMLTVGTDYHNRMSADPKRLRARAAMLGYQHHCPDDGAAGPACMWDARHDGDGMGKSYIWTGHRVVYYQHKVIHQLLNRDKCHRPLPRQRHYWDTIKGHNRIRITRDDRVCSGGTSYAIQAGNPGPVGTS